MRKRTSLLAVVIAATLLVKCSSTWHFALPILAENTKNWLQAVAWFAAALAAMVGLVKFWTELRASRQQRDRDLRWRQAEVGKKLNDEMQTDEHAWPAMQMLDNPGRMFTLPSGVRVAIGHEDVRRALLCQPAGDAVDDEKFAYIRDCFDAFFYYLAILDHYIKRTLVLEEDVAYPTEYYVPLLAKMHGEALCYLQRYRLNRALSFLNRYSDWRDAR